MYNDIIIRDLLELVNIWVNGAERKKYKLYILNIVLKYPYYLDAVAIGL